MSHKDLEKLLYFFQRSHLPIFVPRGLHQNVYFDVPEKFYPPEYRKVAPDFQKHISQIIPASGDLVIKVEEPKTQELDLDIEIPKQIDRKDHFNVFNPFHQKCAAILIKHLTESKIEDLLRKCVVMNLKGINPYLFQYALSVALVHRDDTKHLPLPSPLTSNPEFFLPKDTLRDAILETTIVPDENKRNAIKILRTATDMAVEHRVAYFREDIGINIHHYHWHVVYPFIAEGPLATQIVNKDRRGELFYYMHQQLVARYNTERLCNKLLRAVSLSYFRDEISEAYFPKLDSPYTKHNWAGRPDRIKLSDVVRDAYNVKILDMELWRDRILDSIQSGLIVTKDGFVKLDEEKGIDILGNIIEASTLSQNHTYYGDFHNFGHLIIAYSHDPDNRYLETMGVMGDNRTAMRDPLFYRWHTFIDDVFVEHKKLLPPYTEDQLTFKDVEITNFKVVTQVESKLNIDKPLDNEFVTYFQNDKADLAYGLDLGDPGHVYVQFSHLQHKDFDYHLQVKNNGPEKNATIRIFIAPATDETDNLYDKINPSFILADQRRLFIELDKFVQTLKANDTTMIQRSSQNSSVTIPYEQTFADLGQVMEYLKKTPPDKEKASNLAYCGCGWPHHMLIPKGTHSGFPCHLFAMITNYDEDKVGDVPIKDVFKTEACVNCPKMKEVTAISYCGLRSKKYPDKKPMGFPFDRLPPATVRSVYDFCKPKNMAVIDVKIRHEKIELDGTSMIEPNRDVQKPPADPNDKKTFE